MTKSKTEANSYTVTYANGTATSGTLPSAQTSKNTITYTANGWTTRSAGCDRRDYANGVSYGVSATSDITLYPNFTTATKNGGVTLGTNNMAKSSTTKTSQHGVMYVGTGADDGQSTPARQFATDTTTYTANGWTKSSGSSTRDYANGAATGALSGNLTLYPCFSQSTTNDGVTLASNTMIKSNTTADSYTVTYARGNASSTTNLPSKQTSIDTTKYTANGWKTTAYGTAPTHANGASTGTLTDTLVLYPYFSESTTNSGVTLSSNTVSRSSTNEDGYTVTYAQGTATIDRNLPSAQTATDTRSYTHSGWTTSQNGSKTYTKGASTGALSSNITLYPYFDSSVTRGSVTLATNSMEKADDKVTTYVVTLVPNDGVNTYSYLEAIKWKYYTADGWTKSSGSTTRSYTNGQSVQVTSAMTLYPCFKQSTTTESVTLPTPTRTGYTFRGWATSGTASSGTTGSYTPTESVKLWATWEANKYTVVFNGNGATSGSMSNQEFTYDQAQNLTPEAFDREYTVTYNYNGNGTANTTAKATATFNGWATTVSGNVVYTDKQSVSNLATSGTVNLYAN